MGTKWCSLLILSAMAIYMCYGQADIPIHKRESWLPASCPNKTMKFFRDYGYINRNETEKIMQLEDLQTALRTFQGFNQLPMTAKCDVKTVDLMFAGRCGCPDVVKGDEEKEMQAQNLLGPAEYRIGNSKWDDTTLTWKISDFGRKSARLGQGQIIACLDRAFQHWADVTPLTFRYTSNRRDTTHIDIQFLEGRHQTRPPFYDFDGPSGVLAHAFFPKSGVVHFDDSESFVIGSDKGTDLCIVAAHEFGHTLGISHSNINDALMAPYYRYKEGPQLNSDDIAAVQAIYGRKRGGSNPRPQPTPAPTTTPRPTTRPKPDYCGIKVAASFKIRDITYIFSYEKAYRRYYRTYVYKVKERTGLDRESRTPIHTMFWRNSRSLVRAYPSKVDAAAYIADKRYLFLFSGSRVYRYTEHKRIQGFILDEGDSQQSYPRWMDVTEFPESPQAALEIPMASGTYFLLIFGKTMVWDWHFESRPEERVGGWAYPLDVFGRRMPKSIDAAVLYSSSYAYLFQNDKYYEFSIPEMRVMSEESLKPIGQFFKGQCL